MHLVIAMKATAKGSVIPSAGSGFDNVHKLRFFTSFRMTESHLDLLLCRNIDMRAITQGKNNLYQRRSQNEI